MKTLKHLAWYVPLAALIYIYASQAIGVLIGSPEHYQIIAAIGLSAGTTSALVWLSVVIDIAGAAALVFFPNGYTFLAVGLWTWVPRAITGMYGGPENEVFESLVVSVFAILAYLAARRGYTFRPFRKPSQTA